MRLRPLACLLLALAAPPAAATFHLTQIVEVFPGSAANPQAQYVVIRAYAAGQNLVGGHSVTVYGADGASLGSFAFPGIVANGADQMRILVATPQAVTLFGLPAADLAMTPVLQAAGGKVCFETIDCVAWGSYAGADPSVGTPFNSPAAPAAGTAARGLVPGRALVRRLDAGTPGVLDFQDDTNDSAHDFALGAPAPMNNAGQAGTAPTSTCGDGAVTGLEGCDDSNTTSGDGCSATCQPEFCGDGAKTGAETCDDGNPVSGDGCDANCKPTGCGNGVVTAGEACDDGNLVSGDGCDANCTATACGNGVATAGEACDDGNLVSGDGCDANCTPTGCGNGIVTAGEACEPPGVGHCSAQCQLVCLAAADCADADPCTSNERCDAGACKVDPTPVDDAEPCTVDSCDPGGVHHVALADGTACTLAATPATRALCHTGVCAASTCGDGIVDAGAGEVCDGGANCTATCQRPAATPPKASGGGCGAGGAAGAWAAALAGAALSLGARPRRKKTAP
ncbi:MAG: DUF4215 domain-containing protein [Anaeromyxobacter sp.]